MKKYLLYISHLYAFAIVRPLQEEIQRQGGRVAWFLAQKKYAAYLGTEEHLLESVDDVMAFQPDVVFVASNVVPDFFPGIKVQLFHGFNACKRDEARGHFRLRGVFDLYCTQGPSTTVPFKALEKKYRYFKVMETGWSKVDPLFPCEKNPPYGDLAAQPVILFASTFTPDLSAAHRIYDTVAAMMREKRWRWIITFHPKMAPEVVLRYQGLCRECHARFYDGDDVTSLLKEAHVMLSDTSSIISEFLLQKRPVVTFQNRVPGEHLINVTAPEEIPDAINHALTRPASLMTAIDHYIAAIHPYADGRSSERVLKAVDRFLASDWSTLRPRPFNLFRRMKMRIKHRYFKW
jgi:CDP-glycerol glycerophosphotransferase (TagB/SpsB family)